MNELMNVLLLLDDKLVWWDQKGGYNVMKTFTCTRVWTYSGESEKAVSMAMCYSMDLVSLVTSMLTESQWSLNPCSASVKQQRLQVSFYFEAVRPERQKSVSLKKQTKGETLQRSSWAVLPPTARSQWTPTSHRSATSLGGGCSLCLEVMVKGRRGCRRGKSNTAQLKWF